MRFLRIASLSLAVIVLASASPAFASVPMSHNSSLPFVAYTVVLANGSVMKGNYRTQPNLAVVQGEGGVAYDQSSGYLYVTNLFSNISVINGHTLSPIRNVSVGGEPFSLIYDSINGNIYATNLAQQINVINGTDAKLASNISTGTYSSRMALNGKTNQIYLPNLLNQSYEQINLAPPGSIRNVSIGTSKTTLNHPVPGIAYDSLNNTVFLSNFQTKSIVVVNATTGRIVNNIPLDNQVGAMTYNAGRNDIYFALTGDVSVESMNASSYRIGGNMTTGLYPSSIAFDNGAGYIFITDEGNSSLSVYNMTSYREVETLNLSLGPTGAYFSATQSRLYVVNSGSGTLSVIRINGTVPESISIYAFIFAALGISAIIISAAIWLRKRRQ